MCKLTLGVPQGSVLGPILFSIFINDISWYLQNVVSVLFADDTTLVQNGSTLIAVEEKFRQDMKRLSEWCKHNRLYINWSKTHIMFITNKRVILPSELTLDNIKVQSVDEFKLLGITIDNKLSFSSESSKQCTTISKKLFALNRIFYLPFNVKMQFFKTFIMPHFDYCMSLYIYYSKTSIQRLCKMYYLCLKTLFRLKFANKSHNEINEELKKYHLFSFVHRFIFRTLTTMHKISYCASAPATLRAWLTPIIKNNSTYNMRSNNEKIFVSEFSQSKFGDLRFQNFFAKFLNSIEFQALSEQYAIFSKQLITNLNNYCTTLTKIYSKFNCNLDFYFFRL